jgi:hypothetical protein
MTRGYFWQVPEWTRFRTVFEDGEIILGVNEKNEHKLFRKDTGSITFDEREALQQRLSAVAEAEARRGSERPRRSVPILARLAFIH